MMKGKCLMTKKIFLILIVLIEIPSPAFSQNSLRSAILLTHSSGSRLYDYETYMGVDSGDITSVPLEMLEYNTARGYTGSNAVQMGKRWFPEPEGTDWYNWLMAFRETLPSDDVWAKIDSFDITIIKGGIQTCNMVGYGSPSDTNGATVTNKTVETYKWIWREMVELMETRPDKFFVIMTGSASGDENNTPLGARLAHEFAIWAKDTLANGNDPVYGVFPENIYVFDYFHYLADNEHYLKDEYESGYQGGLQDDHPNATACNNIAPLFVQEIFDAAIAYETIVPVELLSFSGGVFNDVVELRWQTASELNNLGFEVQRAFESEEWQKVGFVKGNGTSSILNNYYYDDPVNHFQAKCYYRLKQIDNDGSCAFSDIIEINFYTSMNFKLNQNYPNPFNPSTVISYLLPVSCKVTLKIYDLVGNEVATLVDEYKDSGSYEYKFNTKAVSRQISNGIYFYQLKAGDNVQTRKMILLK